MSTSSSLVALTALTLLLGGCAGGTGVESAAPAGPTVAPGLPLSPDRLLEEVTREMEASAAAWNRGDLDGFLEVYADDPQTTFMGADSALHMPTVREMYRTHYFGEDAMPDRLRFADLRVRPLGPEHSLLLGDFILTDRETGEVTSRGYYTIVMARTPEGWRIIHDHSSGD